MLKYHDSEKKIVPLINFKNLHGVEGGRKQKKQEVKENNYWK